MFSALFSFLGRVCLSTLFLWAVWGKITDLEGTMAYMEGKMPLVPLFLAGAIFIQLVGGFLLLIGYKTHTAAALLSIFVIPAAILFHNFWDFQGDQRLTEQIMFMTDLGVLGGLFSYLAFGPGKWSVDHYPHKNKTSH